MPEHQPHDEQLRTIWWEPSHALSAMWVALAILLGLLALMLLGLLYALIGAASESSAAGFDWRVTGILTLAVLGIHPLIHLAFARIQGARSWLDVDVIQWVLPVIYVRTGDHLFSQREYIRFALAPLGILTGIGVVLMPFESRAALLILPLAANAGLSTRDIWTAWLVWQQPDRTLIEINPRGLRMVFPS
jgi:hypothetical protein